MRKNERSFSPIRHREHNIFSKSIERKDNSTEKSPHRRIVTVESAVKSVDENTPRFKPKIPTFVDSIKNIFEKNLDI